MKIIDCDQGSELWFRHRSGKVTASEVADAISFRKSGDKGSSAAREALKARIVAETLTGEPDLDGFVSQCMKDGNEFEPFARTVFEMRLDVSVKQVGFILHPTIERAGASPDGIIMPNGGVELKCPKSRTHIEYMTAQILPPEYEPQVMMNIACAEADFWYFASFGHKFTGQASRHNLFSIKVPRNDARIAEIEDGVRIFLQEVDDMIGALERLNPEPRITARTATPPPLDADGNTDLGKLADELMGSILQ